MELSVIENDHIEVKKYLENFVPDNYYRVLGDAYLYQVRAVLQHAVRNAGEYNVRYDSLINSLTAQFEQNRVNIGQEISAWGNKHTVHAQRLTYLEAENNTVSASITELEKIIISNNKAILEKTNKLAAQLVDFEVGGVNLIHNSTFAKGYKAVGDVAITTSDHVLGTLFKIVNLADVEEEIGIGSLVEFNKIKLMEGKQYTLSFYGFGSVELINSIKLNKGDLVHTLDPIIMDSDISNRKTLTFIAPFSGDDIGFSIGTVGYPIDSWFSLVAVQLELGSRATDWSPSPFDNADYIARVAASLEEVRQISIEQQAVNVAAIDTLRANIGETKGQISNEREVNLTKFSSMTRQLDELTSSTAGNTSRITNLDNTYTDKFTANAEKFVELEANIGASNAAITRVDEVVSTNTSAIATSTNNLSAKIDGIKIGGRNLIRNSTFKLGHEAWGDATITRKDTVLGSEVTITNNGSAQFGIQNDVLFHTISLVEGDEYTLSFYGNGNIPSINSIWLKSEGKDPQLLSEIAIDAVLAEKKVLTFTSTITADNVSIIIAAAGYPKDSWFKIVALQLEKGNKATDWTEAPEDIVNFISGVEANIDEFKEVQVGINGATATQLNTLNTKTDNSNAAIDELRETTSNIEGSTATLETKLRGEYTSAVSSARSDITLATDGKIDAVKQTLREMTTDISSKADITRVDSIENNAKQSLATAKTELTSSYTSAISTVRTESATDATNKANNAKTEANTYTDGKVTTLTTLVNSKASISRVDDVENNANQALASTKTELTGEYTSAISSAKTESATDAQNKADAVKGMVDALTKVVDSKASISRVDTVENNTIQALATAKTELTSDYTTSISKAIDDIEIGGRNLLQDSGNFKEGKPNTEIKNGKRSLVYAGGGTHALYGGINLEPNTKYIYTVNCIFSKDTTVTQDAPIHFQVNNSGSSDGGLFSREPFNKLVLANTWTDISIAFETNSLTGTLFIPYIFLLASGTTVYISSLKLEKGNKATAWTAAPEDIEASITAAVSSESTARSTADTAIGNRISTVEGKTDNALARVATVETIAADNKSSIASTKTELQAEFKALNAVKDTRNDNFTPSYYMINHKASEVKEFKAAATIGLPSNTNYYYLVTLVKYGDFSGGNIVQTAYSDANNIYIRASTNGDNWSAWVEQESTQGAIDKVAEAKAALNTLITANTAAITNESTVRANEDTALSNRITTVNAKTDNALSRIATSETAISDTKQALTQVKTDITAEYKTAIDKSVTGARNLLPTKINFYSNDTYTGFKLPYSEHGYYVTVRDKNPNLQTYVTYVFISKTIDPNKAGADYRAILQGSNTIANKSFWVESGDWYFTLYTEGEAMFNSFFDRYEVMIAKGRNAVDYVKAPEDVEADYIAKITSESTARANADGAITNTVNSLITKTDNTNAEINRVNNLVSDNKQSIASTKTDITAEYKTAIKEIQVGGRNYFKNTSEIVANYNLQEYGRGLEYGAPNGFYVVGNSTQTGTVYLHNVLDSDGWWTISFNIRGNQNRPNGATILISNQEPARVVSNSNNTFERRSVSVNVVNYQKEKSIAITNIDWAYLWISDIKLEKGNKVTDWSPAPEDIEADYTAKITSEATTRANADGALSTRITNTEAVANNAQARVGTVETAVATNTGAIAQTTNKISAAIAAIEVGGRNFLANSADVTLNSSDYGNNGLTIHYEQGYKSIKAIADGNVYGYLATTSQMDAGLYTFSMEVNTTFSTSMYFRIGSVGDYVIQIPNTGGVWKKISHTYTGGYRGINESFLLGFTKLVANIPIYFRGLKVEKGNTASDWTPAPEDAMKAIQGTVETINRVEATVSGIKAEASVLTTVGNKVSGWKNLNTGTTSNFDIWADRFTVWNGYNNIAPFIINGSSVEINVPLRANSLITSPIISGGTIMAGTFQGGQIAIGNETVTNNGVITKANFMVTSDGALTAKSGTFSGSITGATGRFTGTVLANNIEGKVANIADLSVDTLQIKDYAVTVPRTLYNGSIRVRDGKAIGEGYFEIHSGTAGGSGSHVKVEIGIDRYNDTEPNATFVDNFRLMRDGVEVRKWNVYPNGSNSNGRSTTKMYFIYAQYLDKPEKLVTYSLQFKAHYAVLDGVSLSLTEVKK